MPRKGGRSKEEIKSNGREIDGENRPNTSGLQDHKMQRKKSMKIDVHKSKTDEDSDTKCCECWENNVQIIKADNWIEYISHRENGCTSCIFHTNTKVSTAVECYCERKTARRRRESRQFRSLQSRLFEFSVFKYCVLTICFFSHVDIASLA